jgi:hypothetical protein
MYVDFNIREEGDLMLNKDTCCRCYQYNEKRWDGDVEFSWDSCGEVNCPCDYFEMLIRDGMGVEIKNKELRDYYSLKYGCVDIYGDVPMWCEFKECHKVSI